MADRPADGAMTVRALVVAFEVAPVPVLLLQPHLDPGGGDSVVRELRTVLVGKGLHVTERLRPPVNDLAWRAAISAPAGTVRMVILDGDGELIYGGNAVLPLAWGDRVQALGWCAVLLQLGPSSPPGGQTRAGLAELAARKRLLEGKLTVMVGGYGSG